MKADPDAEDGRKQNETHDDEKGGHDEEIGEPGFSFRYRSSSEDGTDASSGSG